MFPIRWNACERRQTCQSGGSSCSASGVFTENFLSSQRTMLPCWSTGKWLQVLVGFFFSFVHARWQVKKCWHFHCYLLTLAICLPKAFPLPAGSILDLVKRVYTRLAPLIALQPLCFNLERAAKRMIERTESAPEGQVRVWAPEGSSYTLLRIWGTQTIELYWIKQGHISSSMKKLEYACEALGSSEREEEEKAF